jgi:hypothetical protein
MSGSEFVLSPGAFECGNYAVVFLDRTRQRATKVFKRRRDASVKHVQDTFASEVAAYGIAATMPSIRAITPHFYGAVSVTSIADKNGALLADKFHLDLAYEMQMVPGPFHKIGSISSKIAEPVRSLFWASGIRHMSDASVSLDGNGAVLWVIDFATKEYELSWG